MVSNVLYLLVGIVSGIIASFIASYIIYKKKLYQLEKNQEVLESKINETVSKVSEQLKESFKSSSLDALSKALEVFSGKVKDVLESIGKGTVQDVENKKQLIDKSLEQINNQLSSISKLMDDLSKGTSENIPKLSQRIDDIIAQTSGLQETTRKLREALASPKARGSWGERMAEDILNLVGFKEGINYVKQQQLKSAETIPDFTFLLPNNQKLNMDVKFPLDNYLKYLESDSDSDREAYRSKFVRDVKSKVTEITTRNYINPEDNTLNFAILFVPNQSVYEFIVSEDISGEADKIIDYSMKHNVILTSPNTLFAMLVIIRQSVEAFQLQKNIEEIIGLMGNFSKEWEKFKETMEKMGKKISEAQEEYAKLTEARKKSLEKSLSKIEELRTARGIPIKEINESIQGNLQ
ncbi:MAG: DNA recombination protein RmuC [Candidatus Micrarchaeaceae archaeon]